LIAGKAKEERGNRIRGDMFEAGWKDHRMRAELAGPSDRTRIARSDVVAKARTQLFMTLDSFCRPSESIGHRPDGPPRASSTAGQASTAILVPEIG
jgi:hypothetical protein